MIAPAFLVDRATRRRDARRGETERGRRALGVWSVAARIILLTLGLLITHLGGLKAQDDPAGDPTGSGGDYNGLVTTAGSYDAYSGNAKRVITDLVVPGSNGSYPLAFTRYANSRATFVSWDAQYFAESGNWRHSYQWLVARVGDKYTVAYPDGRVVNFRIGRSSAPTGETFARGPLGTSDRLEISGDGASLFLHLSDGGIVTFQLATKYTNPGAPAGTYMATSIADRYGAATRLTYNALASRGAFLSTVTEPGGRAINFTYQTLMYTDPKGAGYMWVVLSGVNSTDSQGNVTQSVSYQYPNTPVSENGTYYQGLTGVVYNQETNTSGGVLTASYGYYNGSFGLPLLTTCDDPHYGGPMTRIQYILNVANSGVWGTLQHETNFPRTGSGESVYNVSSLTQDQPNTPKTATDTRGDKDASGNAIFRTFKYGEQTSSPYNATTNAVSFQSTTATDFEGHATYIYYNAAGSANGQGYVCRTLDPTGTNTLYQTEPYVGQVTMVTLPDSRKRSTVWGNIDGSAKTNGSTPCLEPYYVFQTTDERNQSTVYQRYTNTGLVYEIDYPDGTKESYQYQAFPGVLTTYFKVSACTTRLGATITYTYGNGNGGSGRSDLLTAVSRAYNGLPAETTQFYYDNLDRMNKTVGPGPKNVTESYTYTGRHQLAQVLHAADGSHVDYGYDDYGRQTKVTDEMGGTTTVAYDSYERPISTQQLVNAYGITTRTVQFTYDRRSSTNSVLGQALSHTSGQFSYKLLPSGRAERHTYSPNHWLATDQAGWSSGGAGNPSIPSPVNEMSAIQRDPLGRVLQYTDAQGKIWKTTFDSCGRKHTATDPLNHTTTWNYYAFNQHDSNGRLCTGWLYSVTAPGPDLANYPTVTTTYTSYDANGYPSGRQVPTQDNSSTLIFSSTYDAVGDLLTQSDGLHTTSYVYDQLGRKTKVKYPDGTSTEKWNYYPAGTVNVYTNRYGTQCTYQYDGRNRLSSYSWSDGSTLGATYGYDNASRLRSVQNVSALIQYVPDAAGGIVSESEKLAAQSSALTTNYKEDIDGNISKILYPSGVASSYSFDGLGRCSSLFSGSSTYSRYDYSGDQLSGYHMAPGLYTSYGYQANGRLDLVWLYHGDAGTYNADIRVNDYGFNPDGRLSWWRRRADDGSSHSRLENGNGDSFTYYTDGGLRYADHDYGGIAGTANGNGDSQSPAANGFTTGGSTNAYYNIYAYDAAGNRSSPVQQMGGPVFGYSQNTSGDNQYNGSSYDGNGNTTNSAVGWTYSYDAEGKMMSGTGPSGQSIGFAYDGLGRLIAQVADGVPTSFYYAGSQRIEEHDLNTNALRYLYFFAAPGSDRIIYRSDYTGTAPTSASAVLWYLYDAMGNTTHLCDNNGAVVEQYLYDAYGTPSVYDALGNFRSGGTSYKNHYLYRGASAYEWLAQPGLCYCRARFYLPQHGRFLQPDPIGQAGGLNVYAYCGNDPVNGTDPSGLNADNDKGVKQSSGYGSDGLDSRGFDSSGAYHGSNDASWYGNSGSSGGDSLEAEPVIITGSDPGAAASPNGSITTNTNDPAIGLGMGGRGGGGGIGEPGPIGSMIPGYGNGRNLINDVQTGHYGWAAFHGVMLASDAMLLKSLVVGVAKGAVFLGAKVLVKEAAAEEAPQLLNQFNSVESLLEKNVGNFTKLKGGVQQATIQGNGPDIFRALSQGGQTLSSGAVRLPNGTVIFSHISTTTGEFTLDINAAGQIYKIRIGP